MPLAASHAGMLRSRRICSGRLAAASASAATMGTAKGTKGSSPTAASSAMNQGSRRRAKAA